MPDLDQIYRRPLRPREIRLLEIKSTEGDVPFTSLQEYFLDDAPPYYALSYVWGSTNDPHPIIVNDEFLHVTQNLHSVLLHIKAQWEKVDPSPEADRPTFLLWVDAVCINQTDVDERNQQVPLMRDIYSNANVVFCWLGADEDGRIKHAFETVAVIRKCLEGLNWQQFFALKWLTRYPELCQDDEGSNPHEGMDQNSRWSALCDLFNLAYWKRVWIFQEIVLAQKPLLACPTMMLPFPWLEHVCNRIRTIRTTYRRMVLTRPEFLSKSVWTAITTPKLSFVVLAKVVLAREHVPALKKDPEQDDAKTAMQRWLVSSWVKELRATNPKDYVYGFLGVTGLPIVPDYSPATSLAELHVQYIQKWLENYNKHGPVPGESLQLKELFFLGLSGVGIFTENEFSLPSWTLQYTSYQVDTSTTTGFESHEADLLFAETCREKSFVEGSSLFVHGFETGTVELMTKAPATETWYDGTLLDFVSSFRVRHPSYSPKGTRPIPPLQALFRLVTKDTSSNVDKVRILKMLAFFQVLRSLRKITLEELYRRLDIVADNNGSYTESFFRNVFPNEDTSIYGIFEPILAGTAPRDTLMDRYAEVLVSLSKLSMSWRFAELSTGHICAIPKGAERGDVVCILRGCGAPVVLRRVSDHFVHVGTCFVVGMMNGEMVDLARNGSVEVRRFEIH